MSTFAGARIVHLSHEQFSPSKVVGILEAGFHCGTRSLQPFAAVVGRLPTG